MEKNLIPNGNNLRPLKIIKKERSLFFLSPKLFSIISILLIKYFGLSLYFYSHMFLERNNGMAIIVRLNITRGGICFPPASKI